MITRDNIASHELIGLHAEIIQSENAQIVGVSGKIVDETKYMLTLDTEKGLKSFPKDSAEWKFVFNGGTAQIDGTKLTKRSYERMGVKA
ncbi:MAG: ribonuclease P protein subunit [Thaumarchaeota archaeon]|nr:ribonuclease P protein subunit [Nitrososphaerota archaeon]